MGFLDDRILIIDSSSVIQIKQDIKGSDNQDHVLSIFTKWCMEDRLVFPNEIFTELNQYKDHDRVKIWSATVKTKACRFGHCHEELLEVMSNPIAKQTVDPDQSFGKDEADPHILATALKVSSELDQFPVVVTEESRKKIPFVSLNVAANALGFTALNLYALLLITNVWKDEFRQRRQS